MLLIPSSLLITHPAAWVVGSDGYISVRPWGHTLTEDCQCECSHTDVRSLLEIIHFLPSLFCSVRNRGVNQLKSQAILFHFNFDSSFKSVGIWHPCNPCTELWPLTLLVSENCKCSKTVVFAATIFLASIMKKNFDEIKGDQKRPVF